ncbi:cytochrome P450 [Haliea sp. E17]|uniref:cytochrome P450 n=1 Tax=Haliea sp. E17 TaxID=3401576 RepID=UPI003AAE4487
MQAVSELDLATLPVETQAFADNPVPYLEAAKEKHPWLAKFSKGYVVYGLQPARDLLYMDQQMGPHFKGLVEHFGAENTEWARFMGDQLATISGERHDRLRANVALAFTPRRANATRPLMREVIGKLLDEWAPKGEFDFCEFASLFPITVMCGLLGMSAEPVHGIRKALDTQMSCMTLNRDLLPDILDAYQVLRDFAASVIEERESSGKFDEDSLLDALIASKKSDGMDANELSDLVISLWLAGYDTSKNMLTMALYTLLEHPDMYRRCAEEVDYCGKVIEEMLRHTSVVSPSRTLFSPVDYAGIHFPTGTYISFALSLTGRDAQAYPNPLDFDPEREQKPRHLAFGRGTHICLGQYLARAQLEEGLHLVAQRIHAPKLAGEVTWRPFLGAWGLNSLPIKFEA